MKSVLVATHIEVSSPKKLYFSSIEQISLFAFHNKGTFLKIRLIIANVKKCMGINNNNLMNRI